MLPHFSQIDGMPKRLVFFTGGETPSADNPPEQASTPTTQTAAPAAQPETTPAATTTPQATPNAPGAAPQGAPAEQERQESAETQQQTPEIPQSVQQLSEQLGALNQDINQKLQRLQDLIEGIGASNLSKEVKAEMRGKIAETLDKIQEKEGKDNETVRENLNLLRLKMAKQSKDFIEKISLTADAISVLAPAWNDLWNVKTMGDAIKVIKRYGKMLFAAFSKKKDDLGDLKQVTVETPAAQTPAQEQQQAQNPAQETVTDQIPSVSRENLTEITDLDFIDNDDHLKEGYIAYQQRENGLMIKYRAKADGTEFQRKDSPQSDYRTVLASTAEHAPIQKYLKSAQRSLSILEQKYTSTETAGKQGLEKRAIFAKTILIEQQKENRSHPNNPIDVAQLLARAVNLEDDEEFISVEVEVSDILENKEPSKVRALKQKLDALDQART